MHKNLKHTAMVAVVFGIVGLAQSAPLAITLPAETAKLRESTLPGHLIATQKCATCHSADYINYQPPGMTLQQWTAEVGKMQHVYGAPLTDDDVRKVGAYLAVAYGSAKESELPAELRAAPVAAASPDTGNATALLNANGCLACHGIDKKIVGPGYHDVAVKYRGDAQAVSKLEASIRNGSVGKWGEVPMPPFSQLQPEEIRALVQFVLKQ
jgi:cytochrome c551/c552